MKDYLGYGITDWTHFHYNIKQNSPLHKYIESKMPAIREVPEWALVILNGMTKKEIRQARKFYADACGTEIPIIFGYAPVPQTAEDLPCKKIDAGAIPVRGSL